ncbi:MAG: cytochrome c family protein [Deltaproteobacteria bacterium]|nr:cytochrome c family protein [Deltaproteobacteria bacterium]
MCRLYLTVILFFSLSFNLLALPKIAVTGDFRGEIKPCGCSEEGDKGGIERQSTYFKQLDKKEKRRIWLDLGNFSGHSTPQGILKTEMIAKLFQKKKLFAILPGPMDFARGTLGFKEMVLPYVVSNLAQSLPNVKSVRNMRNEVAVFGYLSSETLSRGKHQTKYLRTINDFVEILNSLIINQPAKFKVLLFRGNEKELALLKKQGVFDLIIPANDAKSEEFQKPEIQLAQERFQVPPLKGQGVLEFSVSTKAGKTSLSHQLVWLTSTYKDDPSWKKDFDDYQKKVEALFFLDLERQQAEGDKSLYKGAEYCLTCHSKIENKWKASKHAHAWKTLVDINRNFDPECVKCHTLGYQKGGFLTEELTPKLINVQCENCHGITPEHETWGGKYFGYIPYCKNCHGTEDPSRIDPGYKKNRKKVTETLCKGCHMGSHSPSFKFDEYWPVIQH